MTAAPFMALQEHLWNARINFASDTIKCAIATSAYTPNLQTHDFFDDVTNQLANGNGYTTGGATLASKTITRTDASSWGTSRANSTAYALGAVYRPASANGYVYECVAAGTSAASPPTFTTIVGDDFTDGTAVFSCRGRSVLQIDFADPSWASSTISTARHFIFYKDTGTASTSPLIAIDTLGADAAATSNTTLVYQVEAMGLIVGYGN